MLDVDLTKGNSSIVKFGGYDTTGLTSPLMVFNTSHPGQWILQADTISYGDENNNIASNVDFVFSADKFFLYMPPTELRTF